VSSRGSKFEVRSSKGKALEVGYHAGSRYCSLRSLPAGRSGQLGGRDFGSERFGVVL
jgi:hypothetical protein